MIEPALLTRIRNEFWEMPGLLLTRAQARHLWQLDSATCAAAIHALVQEGFLRETPRGIVRSDTLTGMHRPATLARSARGNHQAPRTIGPIAEAPHVGAPAFS